ncbi:hypothetical protein HPB47_017618 [Ixodes persulcatus]|uniref:Uncharacterized protein n=1 Tax=Ixodes persulcatus TaxID=34615 RepID=A0AC60QN22_IXOPE|nr:hypothetical protein HPB47_017618 [Ixodes persulcatus]
MTRRPVGTAKTARAASCSTRAELQQGCRSCRKTTVYRGPRAQWPRNNAAFWMPVERTLSDSSRRAFSPAARSPARPLAYKKLYGLMNDGDELLKILQAWRTQRLSLEIAVSRIVDQWTESKTHFEMARRPEKCDAAEALYGMYENQINLEYLLVLRPILTDVQKVTMALEAKDVDQTKLLKDIITLLSSLVHKVVIPTEQMDVLTSRLEDDLNPRPYLGYLFETYVDNMKEKSA